MARRLGKTPAWVSQRLALLELTPSLQEKVESGELKVEPARRIGRMPKEQQAEAAELAINAVKPPRQRGPKAEEAAAAGPPSASSVNGVRDHLVWWIEVRVPRGTASSVLVRRCGDARGR
ncbi:hypothetical protein [Streptomyces albogriseolus]